MPASSAAPTGYQLNGLIERVTFFSEESGFCVLRVKAEGHRDLVTVVGSAASVSAGEWLAFRTSCSSRVSLPTKVINAPYDSLNFASTVLTLLGHTPPMADRAILH